MTDDPIRLMRFVSAVKRDPAVERWFETQSPGLGEIAKSWFDVMRACGNDVRELLHDGHPTACIGDAAFCYVNAFSAHINVGFFLGAWLDDPDELMQGTGKRMRHVKVQPGEPPSKEALERLIRRAYDGMHEILRKGAL